MVSQPANAEVATLRRCCAHERAEQARRRAGRAKRGLPSGIVPAARFAMSERHDVRDGSELSFHGLSSAEIAARLERGWFNELSTGGRVGRLADLANLLRESMSLLLLICGAIYAAVGDGQEAIMPPTRFTPLELLSALPLAAGLGRRTPAPVPLHGAA
jgi:hypothetical protein